jgi:hypothetical protein
LSCTIDTKTLYQWCNVRVMINTGIVDVSFDVVVCSSRQAAELPQKFNGKHEEAV